MRPKIAITGPSRGGLPAFAFTAIQVWLAGGSPQRLHPDLDWQKADFDGLIIGGGADIESERYQEKKDNENIVPDLDPTEDRINWFLASLTAAFAFCLRMLFNYKSSRGQTDPERDEMELYLLNLAVSEAKPVFGICRGMQMINIFFGGTLNQDLSTFYNESPNLRTVLPRKTVDLHEGSQLSRVVRRKNLKVNSLHDQAVDRLGENLKVSASEGNGVIQAIEADSEIVSIIGVQWHPEFLIPLRSQRRLFHWLVDLSACKSVRGTLTSAVQNG